MDITKFSNELIWSWGSTWSFGATSYLLPKIFVLGGYRFSDLKRARAFGKGTPLYSKPNNNSVASLVRLINGRRVSLHIDWECALALWPSSGQSCILSKKTCTASFYCQPFLVCKGGLVSRGLAKIFSIYINLRADDASKELSLITCLIS